VKTIDVLGLGSLAVDDVLYVPEYPRPDTKIRATRRVQRCGGLTGTALAAAAKLGATCAYAGRFGTDSNSILIRDALNQAGVSTEHAAVSGNFSVGASTIIISPGARTIFTSPAGETGAGDSHPSHEVILASKVLLVDHHGIQGGIRAAQIARANGIRVVGDFERLDSAALFSLMSLTTDLILSETFAIAISSTRSISDAVHWLRQGFDGNIVLTAGSAGTWFSLAGMKGIQFCPAIEVVAVDTLGCGDVFHGAFAACLAFGMETAECIRIATRAAGLKAARSGGWENLPTLVEVTAKLSGEAPYLPE
jgi:sulfofructose kinase